MMHSFKFSTWRKTIIKQTNKALKSKSDRFLAGGALLLLVTIVGAVILVMTTGKSRLMHYQNYTSKVAMSNSVDGAKNANVTAYVDVVGFDEKGIPTMEPAKGFTNLLLKVKIKNTSKRNLDFYPSIQSYIRDSQGGYYTMHPAMSTGVPLEAGQIKPGETLEGELSYEVSKHLVQPRYYLDANWDGGPMVFDLHF
jgi:hypothetical protein